jgi:hypothetical protein
MTRGVPLVAGLSNAYREEGLVVISITAYNDKLKDFLAKHEARHSIAVMSISDKSCDYVDIDRNGFTYAFIIGRNGKILWRDNYVVKEKEFLKALGGALRTRYVPPLERDLDLAIQDAVAEYLDSGFAKARDLSTKAKEKYSRKEDDASRKIVEDADYLTNRIGEVAKDLLDRMRQALEDKKGLPFVEALDALTEGFAKCDEAKEAQDLEKEAVKDKSFSAELKAARALRDLLEKYPVLFPIEANRESKSFAKKLAKFVKDYKDLSAAREAEKLLGRYKD